MAAAKKPVDNGFGSARATQTLGMDASRIAGAMHAEMRSLSKRLGRRAAAINELRVGIPGDAPFVIETSSILDPGLRHDVTSRALEGLVAPAPLAWLVRTGEVSLQDHDLAWFSAVRRAFDAHDLPLRTFHVVTRRGWIEVVSGQQIQWRRLRA